MTEPEILEAEIDWITDAFEAVVLLDEGAPPREITFEQLLHGPE